MTFFRMNDFSSKQVKLNVLKIVLVWSLRYSLVQNNVT